MKLVCSSGYLTKSSPITGTSAPTATRDLADMVEKGALMRSGERRHARYRANIELRPVLPVLIDEKGRIVEGARATEV